LSKPLKETLKRILESEALEREPDHGIYPVRLKTQKDIELLETLTLIRKAETGKKDITTNDIVCELIREKARLDC